MSKMSKLLITLIVMIALPVGVFRAGVAIMSRLSGHVAPAGQTPINQRFGYDANALSKYWGALQEIRKLDAERSFLKMDLIFPIFYGAALAASLLWGWAALDPPFGRPLILAPVFLQAVSDWTENLTQLRQLRLYLAGKALETGWVRVASAATTLKLLLFYGVSLLIVVLAALALARIFRRA